ncbi:MFS transporter [Nonomuraea sp. NPDC050547]|uniref:MFS transporter n=1 Tax=unclassified Nonomuraea TaxID=2593643 RepID=UPI0037B21786
MAENRGTEAETLEERPGSLFRVNRSFRLLFAAAAVSMFGTQIRLLALPLVAVIVLNASPGQVGVLGMLGTIAFLLIGLPAGAWMDRVHGRRRVMVVADLVRAALVGSVPVAYALGVLSLPQLYVVVVLSGFATVFFDVSSQSYLPAIVSRERLVEANSHLGGMEAVNNVAGPAGAGFLIQLITAPLAAAVDAVGYVWSALCLSRIRDREAPPPPPEGGKRHLVREIREGLVLVFGHPLLRAIAINGAMVNMSVSMIIVIMPLMFQRELGLSAFTLGLFFAVDGIGMLLGALTARRVTAWLGQGRGLWIIGLAVVPACAVFPLVDRGIWLWLAGAAWLVLNYRIGVNNVILISFRQQVTPTHLLGRMNATMRFLMHGVLSLGAALTGLIGQFAGVRTALWVGAAGLALAWLPLYFSPMRKMRELPREEPES